MSRILKYILAANLLVLAILAFVHPHLMVSPGKLIVGHQKLEADCFACHAPFRGVSDQRCISCHKPAEIGRLSSAGLPLTRPLTTTPFHQKLTRQDCTACHSDHAGVKRYRLDGRFNHSLLAVDSRQECQACHKTPTDVLHRQISGNCSQCHSQEKWTPATFDHDKLFQLDRDHKVKCATCHIGTDYTRYTCYGCHEHSTDNIRRKHIKEGIRDYRNCVECHRNANEHDIRMPGREREHGDGREREHD